MPAPVEFAKNPAVARTPRGARFYAGAAVVVALHVAALAVLLYWEYGAFRITLVVLRRPGVSAALALTLFVLLIALSRFKWDILQLSLTFLDFLIIDRDTFSFLLSVFPQLRTQMIVAGV